MLRKMKVVSAILVGMKFLVARPPRQALSSPEQRGLRLPDTNAVPRPFKSILGSLYARAIFLDNGTTAPRSTRMRARSRSRLRTSVRRSIETT